MKYLFGPVNSRRLGISLGIDLVPFKTCTLNCIYCECGPTTHLTSKISDYVPAHKVIDELREYLSGKPSLDMLTFSGSGEPTLHRDIGAVIDFLKDEYSEYKISVLTNGTLLWIDDIRRSILRADKIIPSLDAVSEDLFAKIARPVEGITAEKLLTGLTNLRDEFRGEIILEIFIVPGINDNERELLELKKAVSSIRPDSVQLNTLDRPGAEEWVVSADLMKLEEIKRFFKPLPVEIIGRPNRTKKCNQTEDVINAILSTIERRPSTIDDLSNTLGIRIAELNKVIRIMLDNDLIEEKRLARGIFLKLKRTPEEEEN